MKPCKYCKKPIDDNVNFCPVCGKKQVDVYTQTFRRGNMTEKEFIDNINRWFATYPHVANVKGEFLFNTNFGLFVNKYCLDAFAIEYEIMNGTNKNQYAVTNLSAVNIVKTESNALLAKWKTNNPHATVLRTGGGIHQRGSTGSLALGGFGAANNTQLYIFFKFDRATGTA